MWQINKYKYKYNDSGICIIKDLLFNLDNIESFNAINNIVEKANFLTWTGLRHAIPSILKTIEYTTFTENLFICLCLNAAKRNETKDKWFLEFPSKGAFVGSVLRWLNWICLRGYLPSLSINYVAKSKDMGKRLPQLYYIKMKVSYDLGFIAIGVAMAT